MQTDYREFLESKRIAAVPRGMSNIPTLARHPFPFQHHCVEFGLRSGSFGCFLDTGLGKTTVELEWLQHALEASNRYGLILTPLAVARQIEREGKRWGYPICVIREQSEAQPGINVCNYDRLSLLGDYLGLDSTWSPPYDATNSDEVAQWKLLGVCGVHLRRSYKGSRARCVKFCLSPDGPPALSFISDTRLYLASVAFSLGLARW